MQRITVLAALFALAAASLPAQKATPPAPTAPRPFEFPKHQTRKLANGLTVFVVEDARQPRVSVQLVVFAGGIHQAPAQAGLASMTAGLLREGTAARTSQQISKLVDTAGGALGASASDDTASVSATFMKSYADLGLELLSDIVLHPKFDQEELDRQRTQALSGLTVQYNDPEYLAPLAAARAILGQHPYAYPNDGTPDTLRALKREDLAAFHKRYYTPGNAYLVFAGDMTAAEAFAKAEKYLGKWEAVAAPAAAPAAPPAPAARVLIVDMPNAVQTQIQVGHLGIARNHPDYLALALANQVFGGSFNSRLNMKLRANEGLTYGAHSSFETNRLAGMFVASTYTRTEKTADAIRMLVDLMKELRANPATEQEFNEAKAYMTGVFGISLETAGAVAGRVVTAAVNQLGDDYWPKYRERLLALKREDVIAAVQRNVQPDKLSIVAVGNAKEFSKALEAYGPVTILKGDELDLTAPDLKKTKTAAKLGANAGADGKKLVDAAVQAMGGLAALNGVKDVSGKGSLKLKMGPQALDGQFTEETLYPDRYKMALILPMGQMTQVLDGAAAWMGQGPVTRDMPPQVAAEMRHSVLVSAGIELLRAAAAGRARVNALETPQTVQWSLDGFEVKITFDAATRLISKLNLALQGQQAEVTFSGYKAIGGVQLPMQETLQGDKGGYERTFTERSVNTGLKAETFAKPKQ